MIIEATEELLSMIVGRSNSPTGARMILSNVMDVIERDYVVQPRCPEQLSPELRCNMPAGHGLRHRTKGTNGSEIYFENLVDNSTGVE